MFFNSDRPYHELHACEHCGLLSAQQFAYIDKHGDMLMFFKYLLIACAAAALVAYASGVTI